MIPVERLGPGLHRLELPLPIPRLESVNCYVFDGDGGLVIIDPGGGHDAGYAGLVEGLRELGKTLGDIRAAVCTHQHPDHMGLATRLVEETGCDYVMHRIAGEHIDGYNDWLPYRRWAVQMAGEHGAPPDKLAAMAGDMPRPDWAPQSMPPTVLVEDGDKIPISDDRWLEVMHTPGHEDAHICLVDSRTGGLFSGDHVLPRITPFVPFPPDRPDNLGTYLDSLRRVEVLDPPVTHPAHLATIPHGAARAHQIALHHRRRLEGMLEALEEGPATAWQVMEETFKPNLPPMHLRLALLETLAHLEHLRVRGQVERDQDGDGTWWYREV